MKMERKIDFDIYLLFAALILLGFGVVMVCSSSYILAQERYNDGFFFLKREVAYAFIGILLMIATIHINYRVYEKMAFYILFLSIAFLLLLFVPGLGREVCGCTRWLQFLGFSFQPSEFSKLALIIFLSYVLAKKKEKIKVFTTGFFPLVMISIFIMALIVIQPDFGTAVILGLIVFILLFVAGARLIHQFFVMLAALPLLYYLVAHASYRMERIYSFLDPWKDPTGSGFQLIQSLLAFGTGGIFGVGLGEGKQKLYFLPEPHTDFIFSIIGEELGLVGVTAVLFMFSFLVYRGIKISLNAPDLFGALLALGITSMIGLQAATNIGVSMGMLPTKGLTLPFISYGGTSLAISLIGVGILLNISSKSKA